MDEAYIAIGRAVFAVQMFEMTIVPLFMMHKVHSEPGIGHRQPPRFSSIQDDSNLFPKSFPRNRTGVK